MSNGRSRIDALLNENGFFVIVVAFGAKGIDALCQLRWKEYEVKYGNGIQIYQSSIHVIFNAQQSFGCLVQNFIRLAKGKPDQCFCHKGVLL